MNALTLSSTYSDPGRKVKRSDYEPLPLKWKVVLDYRLSGKRVPEICRLTGYSPPTVYHILNHERTLLAKQFLLEQTQEEFSCLFEKVTKVIEEKLGDPEKQLEAASLWLKANGKFKDTGKLQVNVSAEDIVMQILNQEG